MGLISPPLSVYKKQLRVSATLVAEKGTQNTYRPTRKKTHYVFTYFGFVKYSFCVKGGLNIIRDFYQALTKYGLVPNT